MFGIIVLEWDYFAKYTVRKQFVRSVYSISENIEEGYGKSKIIKLLKEEDYQYIYSELKKNQKKLIVG